jgi:predicted transcriptional regulator
VSTAVRTNRSDQASLLALQEVHGQPGISKDELRARLQATTGLADSTLDKTLRRLEREGHLDGWQEGRHLSYRPVHGVDHGLSPGTTRTLLGLLAAILVAAAVAAFFLAPEKHSSTKLEPAVAPPAAKAPAPAPAPPANHTRVAVLSGSPVPGIAGHTGQQLRRKGFHVGAVANAPGPSEHSSVLYAHGQRGAARVLARTLGIGSITRLDATNASVAAGAKLVVIVGADRRR